MSAAIKLIGTSGSICVPRSNQSPLDCLTPCDKMTASGMPDNVTSVTTVADGYTVAASPGVSDKPRDPSLIPSDNCNELLEKDIVSAVN